MYQFIKFECDKRIATLSINRPAELNSLSEAAFLELKQALLSLRNNPEIRVVVLTGEGKAFCAGGDIELFAKTLHLSIEERQAVVRSYISLAHQVVELFASLDVPLIVAVQGAAAGFGLSLCCLADLLIATDNSRFVPAYIGLAATPDGALSYTLPRLVGERRAAELLLMNRSLDAAQAVQWGLANCVVSAQELEEAVQTYAQKIVNGPGDASIDTLKLLTAGRLAKLKKQMALELETFVAGVGADDFLEGVSAFAHRRKPVFL